MSQPVAYPPDVVSILSADELRAVRGAFSEARMAEIAEQVLLKSCSPLTPWSTFIIDRFFRPGMTRWDPGRREQITICLLATSHRGEGTFVAMHLYWALMYLDPADVVETLMLCGTYSGFDATHGGVATLSRVLGLLKKLCAGGEPPDVDAVVGVLLRGA